MIIYFYNLIRLFLLAYFTRIVWNSLLSAAFALKQSFHTINDSIFIGRRIVRTFCELSKENFAGVFVSNEMSFQSNPVFQLMKVEALVKKCYYGSVDTGNRIIFHGEYIRCVHSSKFIPKKRCDSIAFTFLNNNSGNSWEYNIINFLHFSKRNVSESLSKNFWDRFQSTSVFTVIYSLFWSRWNSLFDLFFAGSYSF